MMLMLRLSTLSCLAVQWIEEYLRSRFGFIGEEVGYKKPLCV